MCPSMWYPKPGKLTPDTNSQDSGGMGSSWMGTRGMSGILDALSLHLGAGYTAVCTLWKFIQLCTYHVCNFLHVCNAFIKSLLLDFPPESLVFETALPLQGAQVWSLVKELGSHVPSTAWPKKVYLKKKKTCAIIHRKKDGEGQKEGVGNPSWSDLFSFPSWGVQWVFQPVSG